MAPRGSGKKSVKAARTTRAKRSPVPATPSPAGSVIDGWESSDSDLPLMVSSPQKASPKKGKKKLDSPIEIIDSDVENKPPPKRKGKGHQIHHLSPEYEIEPPTPKSAKASHTKSPTKRARTAITPAPSDNEDIPQGSPRKRVAMMTPSTPKSMRKDQANNPFLTGSPLSKGVVLFDGVVIEKKSWQKTPLQAEENTDNLQVCEVTIPNRILDPLLDWTFAGVPRLRASVSFPEDKLSSISFSQLMTALKPHNPHIENFVNLVKTPEWPPRICNPSRADPRDYRTRIFPSKNQDSVLVDSNLQRISCFTLGVIQKCSVLSTEPMAYNEVMEVKSVQLIPLDHEIERMLAFADMVFGPGINCPTFMDALSFHTIPLNTSKQPYKSAAEVQATTSSSQTTSLDIMGLAQTASRSQPSSQQSTPIQASSFFTPSGHIQKVLATKNPFGDEEEFSLLDFDSLPRYEKELQPGDVAGIVYTITSYVSKEIPSYSFNVLLLILFAGDYENLPSASVKKSRFKEPATSYYYKSSPSKASSSKSRK
ncbi:hypothetical protein QCA50_014647 [Cerrena zonata]|uniref:Uncharacterized protein n=1 Tax=Cerrena zonata TaxID=2478898 RepID=A0AAW0FT07_9APHY